MLRLSVCSAIASAAFMAMAHAQETNPKEAFVEANIRSIFYHELGHAVIDLMEVPIFGQEEDAADVMAVLLIDGLYEEEAAQEIAYDSAFGYISDPEQVDEVAYWDIHGPDEQRYYNHICLFYGANPDVRKDLASYMGLPEERTETCPDEYDQAASSWGVIFDEMEDQATGKPMVFEAGADGADIVNRTLAAEVKSMNAELKLPEAITVRVVSCGDANAFYDPKDVSITFCSEFVPHLEWLFDATAAD